MPPAQGPLSPLGDQGAPYEGGGGLLIREASSPAGQMIDLVVSPTLPFNVYRDAVPLWHHILALVSLRE